MLIAPTELNVYKNDLNSQSFIQEYKGPWTEMVLGPSCKLDQELGPTILFSCRPRTGTDDPIFLQTENRDRRSYFPADREPGPTVKKSAGAHLCKKLGK